jgi:hypothetical protein
MLVDSNHFVRVYREGLDEGRKECMEAERHLYTLRDSNYLAISAL